MTATSGMSPCFVGGVRENIVRFETKKANEQVPDERIHVALLPGLAFHDAANALLEINRRFPARL